MLPVLVLTDQRTEEADDVGNATQFVNGEVIPVQKDAKNEGANMDEEECIKTDNWKGSQDRVFNLACSGKVTMDKARKWNEQWFHIHIGNDTGKRSDKNDDARAIENSFL